MAHYSVCSDHFHDSDYVFSDMNIVKETGYRKRMKLRLKPEAVPNTHPEKDELQLFIAGEYLSEEVATKRVRLNKRTLNDMDSFSSSINTSTFPYTAPQMDDRQQGLSFYFINYALFSFL